jgi:periplasmic copper chaperone A
MKYLLLLYLLCFQSGGEITIHNAWMRPAPETFNSAFYCTIVNSGDTADTLYKAASDISNDVEMHETYMKNDMMGMRPVKNLVIAPHDSLLFKPGGYHIMIINLKENASANSSKEISLYFKRAGIIKVKASVISQR